MKKRYKLIKEYPDSPKLDSIFTYYTDSSSQHAYKNGMGIPMSSIENYPEFWEEVIEKDYEILSFIHNGNHDVPKNTIVTMKHGKLNSDYQELTESHYLNSKCWTIHSIKRLSDGEIFTVGDLVKKRPHYKRYFKINHFYVQQCNPPILWLHSKPFVEGTCTQTLDENTILQKATKYKQPLFTTEDGVDIYHGEIHYIIGNNSSVISRKADENYSYSSMNKKFSTFEKAEEYIRLNKPQFSIEDIKKAYSHANRSLSKKTLLERLKNK